MIALLVSCTPKKQKQNIENFLYIGIKLALVKSSS